MHLVYLEMGEQMVVSHVCFIFSNSKKEKNRHFVILFVDPVGAEASLETTTAFSSTVDGNSANKLRLHIRFFYLQNISLHLARV